MRHWLFKLKEESEYEDEFGVTYHYSSSVPNSKRVRVGDKFVYDAKFDEEWFFLGTGEVKEITASKKGVMTRWGERKEYYAHLGGFVVFEPPLPVASHLEEAIISLPKYNPQMSIREISVEVFLKVLELYDVRKKTK